MRDRRSRFGSLGVLALLGALAPSVVAAAGLRSGDFVMAVRWNVGVACCRVVSLDGASLAVTDIASGAYLLSPADIAVRSDHAILVADESSGIVQIDPTSGGQTLLAAPASLGGGTVSGIAVGQQGELYVSMQGTSPRVLRLSADGAVAIVVAAGVIPRPAGLTIGPDGALYVCATSPLYMCACGGGIVRVDLASGTLASVASGWPVCGPIDLAFAPDGSLWSVQRGQCSSESSKNLVRTSVTDGSSALVMPAGDAVGFAIRSDGVVAIARCWRIHSDCAAYYTQLYPSGPLKENHIAGPMAVVPEHATPATMSSWGRVKVLYR
jgi:DNA-binding beta-propeller fold protein YncE